MSFDAIPTRQDKTLCLRHVEGEGFMRSISLVTRYTRYLIVTSCSQNVSYSSKRRAVTIMGSSLTRGPSDTVTNPEDTQRILEELFWSN